MSKVIAKTALAALAALPLTSGFAAEAQAKAPLTTQTFVAGDAGFAVTSTLIAGEKDAILVDAQFTLSEAHRLAGMILDSGKTLRQIWITHAHPDHYFGLEVLLAQFPNVQVLARPEVVEEARKTAQGKVKYWKPFYGANLTDKPVMPTAFSGAALTLEGESLPLVDLAPGESSAAAAVYVPSLKTLIAGDLAFNHVHLWLAEDRPESWLANLDRVSSTYAIDKVIAGHKDPQAADAKDLLQQDAAYIRAFEDIVKASKTPEEAFAKLKKAYPDFRLPVIADIAIKAAMFQK